MKDIKIHKSLRRSVVGYFSIITLFVGFSCNDIITEDPISIATANGHYTSERGILDGLNAVYTPLRDYYGQERSYFLTVVGTDMYTNGFGGNRNNPSWNNYDVNLTGSHGFLIGLWDSFYAGINQANTVIGRVQDIDEIPQDRKDVIEAQARFLRALYYFILVQQFGDVHFTLEETIGVQTEAVRTPVATIYQNGIVPDLQFAADNLPTPDNVNDYGRVHKAAAEALFARVHLTLGNYSEAETLANNVIDDYGFSLVSDYKDLWDFNNQINSEFIWTVQYTLDPLTNQGGNPSFLYWVWDYTRNPAMVRDQENGRPFQRFMPTNYFLESWNRDGDARWAATFKTVFIANSTGTINGQTVVPGDTAIKISMEPVDDALQASAPYQWIDYNGEDVNGQSDDTQVGGQAGRNFPVLNKYYDAQRSAVNATDGSRDYPVLRLAEMYLISAEAAHMQGRNGDAADRLNELRVRAVVPGYETEMNVADTDVDIDFILDERARELCGEGFRWYDLKRTGKLIERVQAYNSLGGPNIKPMHLVRPIPQTQIDRVTNPGDFPQNEGY